MVSETVKRGEKIPSGSIANDGGDDGGDDDLAFTC